MTGVDPRLVSALTVQLEHWRATLAAGAERVGWKLGIGEGERIGPGPVFGHLTSATQLEPGALYHPEDPVALRAAVANVYHRAFALGPIDRPRPGSAVQGRLVVNGEVRDSATASRDHADLVRATAKLLGAVGERLRAGDRLITGSVVHVPIEPGDDVTADLGPLGQVHLSIAGFPQAAATVSRR